MGDILDGYVIAGVGADEAIQAFTNGEAAVHGVRLTPWLLARLIQGDPVCDPDNATFPLPETPASQWPVSSNGPVYGTMIA